MFIFSNEKVNENNIINDVFLENDDDNSNHHNQKSMNNYFDLAHFFLEKNDYTQAIDNFRLAIESDNTRPNVYRDLGYALIYKNTYFFQDDLKEKLIAQGNIDEAITCFQRAIQLGVDDHYTHIFLGDALTIRKRIKEAQPVYQQAARLKIKESKPNFSQQDWDKGEKLGPQFVIIGSPKCGTSSLYEYLIQHSQILSVAKKEIDFVNNLENGIDWYLSHFPPIFDNFITGEATPSYLYRWRPSISFFSNNFPDCKFIVIIRNPVERVISHYNNDRTYGGENRSLNEVVEQELQFFEGITDIFEINPDYRKQQRGYLATGLYIYFIEKWISAFSAEQLLILQSEDLFLNPSATLTKVFNFLELPDHQLPQYQIHNQGNYSNRKEIGLDQEVRDKLSQFFEPYNRKLELYLKTRFDWN